MSWSLEATLVIPLCMTIFFVFILAFPPLLADLRTLVADCLPQTLQRINPPKLYQVTADNVYASPQRLAEWVTLLKELGQRWLGETADAQQN